jgi:hypothetical protein
MKFGQVGPAGRAPEELTEWWRPGLDTGKKRATGGGGVAPQGRDGRHRRGRTGGGCGAGRAPAGLSRGGHRRGSAGARAAAAGTGGVSGARRAAAAGPDGRRLWLWALQGEEGGVVIGGSGRGRKGEAAAGEKISPVAASFSGTAAASSLPASFSFPRDFP